ncbi:unnamed protein product [Peniophora sp. CBMAI 1063]|nr:unnamed protein product [Peniophora sp. CBMAI 1063]
MNGTILNVVAFPLDYSHSMIPVGQSQASWSTWVVKVPQEEMLEAFSNYGSIPRAILKRIKEPSRWSIHALYPPLESYVGAAKMEGKDDHEVNVALIGDAAHAMLPFLGAGAGAGIEDAYVLARLLAHPQTSRANLSHVLRAYDSIRTPRGAHAANASRRTGEVMHGRGPSGPSESGRRKDIQSQWENIWDVDVKVDVEKAVDGLVKSGIFV